MIDENETGIPPFALPPVNRVSVSDMKSNDRAQNNMRDSTSNNLNKSGLRGVPICPTNQSSTSDATKAALVKMNRHPYK
jgi:hypothetical protein